MRVVLCLTTGLAVTASRGAPEEPGTRPVPSYTDDDLRRIAPFRDQTGVSSEPAGDEQGATSAPPHRRDRASSEHGGMARGRGRGEDYWRREAARAEVRIRPWEKQIAVLQRKIDARRRLPEVRPYTDPQLRDWRRQIDELRVEIRTVGERVEDRARQEGAPPGWLR